MFDRDRHAEAAAIGLAVSSVRKLLGRSKPPTSASQPDGGATSREPPSARCTSSVSVKSPSFVILPSFIHQTSANGTLRRRPEGLARPV